jgi:hypothetical protein
MQQFCRASKIRTPTNTTPKHGPEFALDNPATWPPPQHTTSTDTSRYGPAVATSWDRVHPRLTHRGCWIDHEGELPVIEGTLVRLQVEHLSRPPRKKLGPSSPPGPPPGLDQQNCETQGVSRGSDVDPDRVERGHLVWERVRRHPVAAFASPGRAQPPERRRWDFKVYPLVVVEPSWSSLPRGVWASLRTA